MRKPMGPVSSGPKDKKGLWQPGESGNPAGRPRGARNRLNEAFLKDVLAHWEAHGAAALDALLIQSPGDYVKVVAGLMPREFEVKVNELDELTDEQIATQLRFVLQELAELGYDFGPDDVKKEPVKATTTLQ